ncbi:hypothetical protein [Collimonas humicola]|uniref:hypothetical protein n=1 Tax=Collimonas humicola TaxID=2825886 RepID=UPI001B8BF3C4|nr:hypothetical protein [Collimonas humicola]
MQNLPSAEHQLGEFIVCFQHLEDQINDLLVLMAKSDDSVVRILVNDLEYNKRLVTADVLFSYVVNVRNNINEGAKVEFRKLTNELRKLGERRNDLVHSRYNPWTDTEGNEGLIRTNSKLLGGRGVREEKEEELQPEDFHDDLQQLAEAADAIQKFRLRIIDWLY